MHRVEVMRVRGDWEDAIEEARRACGWLALPKTPEGPADAFYQLGELHRLRGAYDEAGDAYRQASRLGRAPQPGCALLWLAEGDPAAAATAVRHALDESDVDRVRRAELLAAQVDILLELKETAESRAAARDLASLANSMAALPLQALADRALGMVLVAEGDAQSALTPLRRSWATWKHLEVPYDSARVRAAIGAAYLALGDRQSALMEFDAARWVFERLGAAPDIMRLERLAGESSSTARGVLTPREAEVLSLVAAGHTNKAIAAALVISEHTVARHVQNMLQKLHVSSRAGLAAFAVEHGLAHARAGQN